MRMYNRGSKLRSSGREMTSILRSPQALQLTLALIKPDAVAHPLILEAVHQQILSNKFLIVRMRELLWRKEDCQKFYREHEGRFFYQRLVEFMASGPIRAYILAHKDAIQLWRTVMGPTRVFRARHVAPDSIRGSFGLTDTSNTTHGSDSVVSASREIAAFFPDFSEQRWYEEEEPQGQPDAGLSVCEDWWHRPAFSHRTLVQSILLGPGRSGAHCAISAGHRHLHEVAPYCHLF